MELIKNFLQKHGHESEEITTENSSDEDGPENGNLPDFKEVEFCRFCRLSGTCLTGSSKLIEPCHCLDRHFRMAHMSCLIRWIHNNLTKKCSKCGVTYDCIHDVTPLRDWKTNPATDRMMSRYCSAVLVAIIIGLLDSFVIWTVWLTTLPTLLRICVIVVLFAMYAAGYVAAYSRFVTLSREMYIYNCPVVDVQSKPKPQSTAQLMADHFMNFQNVFVSGAVEIV